MKTVGVVLAGGLSTRMHADKTQLIWQGNTLIEHNCTLLKEAGCSEVVISNNNNSDYIKDRYPESGPLAGIEACLHYILSSIDDVQAMLIMPVDMPLMSVELLQNLQQNAQAGKAVYYNLGRFPILLPVSNKLAVQLTNMLEKNSGSANSIQHMLSYFECQVLVLNRDQQKAFYNCNTDEQWQQLTSIN